MTLLNDAFRALAHNLRTLVLALALTVLIGAAFEYSTSRAAKGLDLEHPPAWFVSFGLVRDVAFACFSAASCTIVFTMLGSAIDRPLWKCTLPWEALRRFFTLWFILLLAARAGIEIVRPLESPDAYLLVNLAVSLFLVPVGACVMHRGALVWEELGDTLSVIPRQFRMFVPVFVLEITSNIVWTAFLISISQDNGGLTDRPGALVLVRAADCIIDLLVFSMTWRICMLDRDAGPVQHSDD